MYSDFLDKVAQTSAVHDPFPWLQVSRKPWLINSFDERDEPAMLSEPPDFPSNPYDFFR